jgi:hypothetical protein
MAEMTPSVRSYCSRTALIMDLLPTLLSVIQPVLRSVLWIRTSLQDYRIRIRSQIRIWIQANITLEDNFSDFQDILIKVKDTRYRCLFKKIYKVSVPVVRIYTFQS